MNYEVQKMMIDDIVDNEIVDKWVNITNKKLEKYQELVDRFKECLEDLREKKEAEIRKKEDQMQEEKFKRRMEEELMVEEMNLEIKKEG